MKKKETKHIHDDPSIDCPACTEWVRSPYASGSTRVGHALTPKDFEIAKKSVRKHTESLMPFLEPAPKSPMSNKPKRVEDKDFTHKPHEVWVCPNCLGVNGCMCALAPKPTEPMEQGWEKEIYRYVNGNACMVHDGKWFISFIHKVRQEAVEETKAEQNRIVNSGRKLFQEGQKDERKRLIEKVEKWVTENKRKDTQDLYQEFPLQYGVFQPGSWSKRRTYLETRLALLDDLLDYLQGLKK